MTSLHHFRDAKLVGPKSTQFTYLPSIALVLEHDHNNNPTKSAQIQLNVNLMLRNYLKNCLYPKGLLL